MGTLILKENLDEIRLYNRSFGPHEIAILYGNGNGDLGLTPFVTLESENSSSSVDGRVEFHKFGIAQAVSDFNSSDLSIAGGSLNTFTQDGLGFNISILPSSYPGRVIIEINEGAAQSAVSQSTPYSEVFIKKFLLSPKKT